jgi:hypothetical protein
MTRDVLLMLSSDQPPPPTEEIRWHARESAKGNRSVLVTTRLITDLTPHRSIVAFYGNAALDNRFLGCGCFVQYAPLDSPLGQAVLMESPLYNRNGVPAGARGCIILEKVREARRGESLESLGGIIEATGLPLRLENIPKSPARIQVYFRRRAATECC